MVLVITKMKLRLYDGRTFVLYFNNVRFFP